jgi:hypothetical protein
VDETIAETGKFQWDFLGLVHAGSEEHRPLEEDHQTRRTLRIHRGTSCLNSTPPQAIIIKIKT